MRSNRVIYSLAYYFLFLGGLIGAIVLFSYCTSTPGAFAGSTFYQQLGEGFLSGHTYLDTAPSPRLLTLRNPYNPYARGALPILWDASLYQGHYYLYFGAAPALVPWIPIHWLTGINFNDTQLVFFFCLTGTCYLVWLLVVMAQSQPPLARWGTAIAAIAVCFGTWIPQMLQLDGVYDVPIAGGYCFTALGLLSFWQSRSTAGEIFGSWCFGMAVGCRFFYGLNIVILLSIWLTGRGSRTSWREHLHEAVYLIAPWAVCVASIFAYNYARFGSPLETGIRYQIGLDDFHLGYSAYWQFSNLWHHFYHYFLKPFPLKTWLQWQTDFGHRPGFGKVHGLWVNSPFSLWSLWFLLHIRSCKTWLGQAYGLAVGIGIYTLMVTIFVMLFRYQHNRYMVDFSPWLMLTATWGFMHALRTCPPSWQLKLLAVGSLMALCSAYIGIVAADY